jgi:hypothetical protein
MKKTVGKFLLVGSLALSLFSFNGNNVNATEKENEKYKFNNLEDWKEAVKELPHKDKLYVSKKKVVTLEERSQVDLEKLLVDVNPEVIEEYNNTLVKDIEEINNQIILKGETQEKEAIYELPNAGGHVIITTSSEEISKSNDKKLSKNTYKQMWAMNIPHGDHKYTVRYAISAFMYPDSYAGLITYFKSNSSGLTATSTSKVGTQGVFPTTVVASTRITDSRAEKVGYDINAQGDYTVTHGGYNGIGIVSFEITIISTIKLISMGASNGIDQSYTVDR